MIHSRRPAGPRVESFPDARRSADALATNYHRPLRSLLHGETAVFGFFLKFEVADFGQWYRAAEQYYGR